MGMVLVDLSQQYFRNIVFLVLALFFKFTSTIKYFTLSKS